MTVTQTSITNVSARTSRPIAGGETVFELGQKEVPSPPEFSRMTITTIYLSSEEYDVFEVLPARELRKSRHSLEDDGHSYGVDVFAGPLDGLILAEVGFETSDQMREQWRLPPWVRREVSDDLRFSGGALAGLTRGKAATLLRQLSVEA